MAINIFTLVGSILVDSDEANDSLSKTDSKAKSLGESLGSAVKTAAGVATAVTGAAVTMGTALVGMANDAACAADEVDKMSQKIGLSKEGYQEWSYAMSQSGVDISEMQAGMKTLTTLASQVAEGNDKATASFDALGISVLDSDGKMKSQEELMEEVIFAMANMADSTDRTILGYTLFGDAADKLKPMLNSGAEGIQGLIDRSHELGLVMSDEAVNAGVVYGDTMADVKSAVTMLGTELGVSLMPTIMEVLNIIIDNLPMLQELLNKVLPVLGELLEKLLPPLLELGQQLLPVVFYVIDAILPVVSEIAGTALTLLASLLKSLAPLLKPILELLNPILELLNPILNCITSILEPLTGLVSSILTPILNALSSLLSSVLQPLNTTLGWISDKVGGLIEKVKDSKLVSTISGWLGGGKSDGSHAGGLDYVPFDGYKATLHRGETVLTAEDTGSLRETLSDVALALRSGRQGGTETVVRVYLGGREAVDYITETQRRNAIMAGS